MTKNEQRRQIPSKRITTWSGARQYYLVALLLLVCISCFTSCANQHFRVPAEGPPSTAPRQVELLMDKQVATLHFPAGVYSFYALDDKGFYYRAPRSVVQRTGGNSIRRKGGIFVNKQDPRKLRGYVFYAGALTHVGDFSRTQHQFRD